MKTKKIIKKTIIEPYEFYYAIFEGTLYLPKCEEIGSNAFFKQKFEGNLKLPVCKKIGQFAFYNSKFSGYLDLPDCEEIGAYAFCYSEFSGDANLQNCVKIGTCAFYYSYFSEILNIQKCKYIGFCAFKNSNFSEINIAYNVELEPNCIGEHSSEFIKYYKNNDKKSGTYIWNGEMWEYKLNKLKTMDKYKKIGFRTNERIEEYLDELCRLTKMKRSEIIRISIAALGELEKEDLEEAIERALKYKLTGLKH